MKWLLVGLNLVAPAGSSLDRLELFHYIHQDHKDLVPRVDAVIAKSKASGELEKMIAAAEKQVIAKGAAGYAH